MDQTTEASKIGQSVAENVKDGTLKNHTSITDLLKNTQSMV